MDVNIAITELTAKYRNGSLSPVEVVRTELKKLRAINPRVNPIVFMYDEEEVLQKAKESAQRYKEKKPLGAFDGVPISLKDDAKIKGRRSVMGSWFLETGAFEFQGLGAKKAPKESENSVKMFEDSGAIPLCVTTTPECCCTEGCATYLNGTTRNPHNLNKSPGGSSGGAGTLTALNICYINMGSDMGGSIRIPAANNGVYGFKPSFSFGVSADIPYFPYFAANGPLSNNMDNIILYCQEYQKYTKKLKGVDLTNTNLHSPIKGMKIAVSRDLDGTVDYVDEDVWDGVLNVVKELQRLGAVVEFVEPQIKQLGKSPGKIAVNLIAVEYAEYGRKVREYRGGKFEKYAVPFLMEMCEKGAKLSGEEIKETMVVADVMREIMKRFLTKYDLCLMPSTPIPPRDTLGYQDEGYMIDRLDGKRKTIGECHHSPMAFTTLANVCQNPAVVIPTGTANDKELSGMGKLPISAMFVGPVGRDDKCLKVAYALQKQFPFIPAILEPNEEVETEDKAMLLGLEQGVQCDDKGDNHDFAKKLAASFSDDAKELSDFEEPQNGGKDNMNGYKE